jgi:hypothetical protein
MVVTFHDDVHVLGPSFLVVWDPGGRNWLAHDERTLRFPPVRPTEHGDQDVPPETQDTFVESFGFVGKNFRRPSSKSFQDPYVPGGPWRYDSS